MNILIKVYIENQRKSLNKIIRGWYIQCGEGVFLSALLKVGENATARKKRTKRGMTKHRNGAKMDSISQNTPRQLYCIQSN